MLKLNGGGHQVDYAEAVEAVRNVAEGVVSRLRANPELTHPEVAQILFSAYIRSIKEHHFDGPSDAYVVTSVMVGIASIAVADLVFEKVGQVSGEVEPGFYVLHDHEEGYGRHAHPTGQHHQGNIKNPKANNHEGVRIVTTMAEAIRPDGDQT